MPKRIQRKRTKGWKMPDGAVYVGRPTRWGNPFHGKGSTPAMNIVAFRAMLALNYKWFRRTGYFPWTVGAIFSWSLKSKEDVEKLLMPLRGKDLCCWCPLDTPCHADVLLELANS